MSNDVNLVEQWRDAWVSDRLAQHRASAVGQDPAADPGRKVEPMDRRVQAAVHAAMAQVVRNVALAAVLVSKRGDHEQVLRFAVDCNRAIQHAVDLTASKGTG